MPLAKHYFVYGVFFIISTVYLMEISVAFDPDDKHNSIGAKICGKYATKYSKSQGYVYE